MFRSNPYISHSDPFGPINHRTSRRLQIIPYLLGMFCSVFIIDYCFSIMMGCYMLPNPTPIHNPLAKAKTEVKLTRNEGGVSRGRRKGYMVEMGISPSWCMMSPRIGHRITWFHLRHMVDDMTGLDMIWYDTPLHPICPSAVECFSTFLYKEAQRSCKITKVMRE